MPLLLPHRRHAHDARPLASGPRRTASASCSVVVSLLAGAGRADNPHSCRGVGKLSGVGGGTLPMFTEALEAEGTVSSPRRGAYGGGDGMASSRRLRWMVIIVTSRGGRVVAVDGYVGRTILSCRKPYKFWGSNLA